MILWKSWEMKILRIIWDHVYFMILIFCVGSLVVMTGLVFVFCLILGEFCYRISNDLETHIIRKRYKELKKYYE